MVLGPPLLLRWGCLDCDSDELSGRRLNSLSRRSSGCGRGCGGGRRRVFPTGLTRGRIVPVGPSAGLVLVLRPRARGSGGGRGGQAGQRRRGGRGNLLLAPEVARPLALGGRRLLLRRYFALRHVVVGPGLVALPGARRRVAQGDRAGLGAGGPLGREPLRRPGHRGAARARQVRGGQLQVVQAHLLPQGLQGRLLRRRPRHVRAGRERRGRAVGQVDLLGRVGGQIVQLLGVVEGRELGRPLPLVRVPPAAGQVLQPCGQVHHRAVVRHLGDQPRAALPPAGQVGQQALAVVRVRGLQAEVVQHGGAQVQVGHQRVVQPLAAGELGQPGEARKVEHAHAALVELRLGRHPVVRRHHQHRVVEDPARLQPADQRAQRVVQPQVARVAPRPGLALGRQRQRPPPHVLARGHARGVPLPGGHVALGRHPRVHLEQRLVVVHEVVGQRGRQVQEEGLPLPQGAVHVPQGLAQLPLHVVAEPVSRVLVVGRGLPPLVRPRDVPRVGAPHAREPRVHDAALHLRVVQLPHAVPGQKVPLPRVDRLVAIVAQHGGQRLVGGPRGQFAHVVHGHSRVRRLPGLYQRVVGPLHQARRPAAILHCKNVESGRGTFGRTSISTSENARVCPQSLVLWHVCSIYSDSRRKHGCVVENVHGIIGHPENYIWPLFCCTDTNEEDSSEKHEQNGPHGRYISGNHAAAFCRLKCTMLPFATYQILYLPSSSNCMAACCWWWWW
mmetsp:Transcript_11020/g.15437  ORF Transcript_11020/g.15437 Transcript_11020/m.15437 type:complete len:728 (+) Transcript_11020:1249-3432(+)